MLTRWILLISSTLLLLSCTSHGNVKTYDGLEIFFQENIDISDVDKLGDFLQEIDFTNGEKKSVQLLKTDTSYTLKMIVDKKILKNDSILANIKEFQSELKYSVFPNTYFELHLCDSYFETKKVLLNNE